ncbi:MAG: 4-hydroxy-tetrahydrodipicolinate reductase [Methanomassiliicoccales archaeon]|jgi:4-hydroxy-tetrahydrodipicolinate reductase|nr:4-hydroxy-tetrahydrodipicolinate reductase [Methanomassiliicoccales archaeon]
MIRVVVGGATGKMGSAICRLLTKQKDMELHGAVVSRGGGNVGKRIEGGVVALGDDQLDKALEGADVYVDVTTPAAAEKNLIRVPPLGVNIVVGTTGISSDTMAKFAASVRRHGVSAVVTPNFSIGVNAFWKLCGEMAAVLKDYDVEIIEFHHNQKKDAPSGTAMKAAEIIGEKIGINKFVKGRDGITGVRNKEIGIHSLRGGDVVGEHTVVFAGNRERLELTHRAHSRDAFAEGALAAIRWIWQRKDGKIHTMSEVLGL